MPAPTQEDIDYLRAHPEVAPHFEKQFAVPAMSFLQKEKPTENDIEYLKKHPDVRPHFEAKFGSANEYLKPSKPPEPSRLEKIRAEEKGMSTLEKMDPTRISRRVGSVAMDIGEAVFDPKNWVAAASSTADVVSRIPEIVSSADNLKELGRGAVQGILSTPGAINDLALAGVDFANQMVAGADPLSAEAYESNPVGSGTTRGMLEDWGNDVLGEGTFDFSEPATEAGKTARRIGEFTGAGGIMGGSRAIIPSITGGIGAEVARDVAPDEPGWQALGGIMGAGGPLAVKSAGGGIARAPGSIAPAVRVLTEGGRENIVGGILREAAGDIPEPLPMARSPLAGVEPTLGQATNNPGLLQLEKTMAMGSPEIGAPFKSRLQESHTAARDAVESLRGGGRVDDIRAVADEAENLAQRVADEALEDASTGMTPAQASDVARGRLETNREAFRGRRQAAWRQVEQFGDDALVEIDPLRNNITNDLMRLGRLQDQRALPPDVQEALGNLGQRNSLSSLQDLRSEMGDLERAASAQMDMKRARAYGTIRRTIGTYLDDYEFQNPDVQAAYQTARNLSRLEAELYKQSGSMRQTLGTDRFGGDTTSSADTLSKFIRPGSGGRDRVRQVLAVDSSQEMLNAIGDHMAAQMPQGLAPAQRFMTRFGDTLNEPQMHVVRDRLQAVVNARAAQQALRNSPLNMFTSVEPRAAIKRVLTDPDRLNVVRRLRSQLSRSPQAWDGMRAAYVEELLARMESAIERGADGTPTLKPGVVNKLYRDNADLTREILGPLGENTFRDVADAIEMATRTQRGGYPGGSPTYSLFSGDRFVDHVIEKWLMRPEAPWAMAAGGFTQAGPLGFIAGGATGYGGQALFANAKAQVEMLLRDALLDPKRGRALMLKAQKRSLTALPRSMRPYVEPFITRRSARAGATGSVQTQTQGEPPRKKNPNTAAPRALKVGDVLTGEMGGKTVTYRYLGGDPKAQESWERSPRQ